MFAFICKSEKCLSHGIFCLSHFLFVRELMMGLFLFAYLFTHLVECTVTISIKNINMFSKNYVFSCFPKTLKYDLGNYAMRLTTCENNEIPFRYGRTLYDTDNLPSDCRRVLFLGFFIRSKFRDIY